MNFLAPLFLLGAIGVGLPILFHFIKRTTRERRQFSSLMFLLPSPPRLTRRTRLEHILLLILRCAVICLLAAGFARPFFRRPMPPANNNVGQRVLVLVDASASMRRADLWADAQKRVDSILRNCSPADQVALFTFDRQINPLFSFEQWITAPLGNRSQLLSSKLAQTTPGWGSTQLGSALVQAAEALADSNGKTQVQHGRIELITDLQEGSHLEQLQGYEWPKGVEVALNVLKPRGTSNASIQLVSDSEDLAETKTASGVRVRVSNASGSKHEQFKVGWGVSGKSGFADSSQNLYVPAGQSKVVVVPAPTMGALDRILLQGDDDAFDNIAYASPPEALRLTVTYLGPESETDTKQPLFFLKRAFQETRHQAVTVVAHRPADPITAPELQQSSMIVVAGPLPDGTAQAVGDQVEHAGKTALILVSGSDSQSTLRRLLQNDQIKIDEVRPSSYAMLGEMDFRDPIFSPFADPRFSDFTKIHFWKYARLDAGQIPGARALARFDSGDPALLEVSIGTGRVLILTSGWQPEASQLALSSKFVPLLYSMLESSGVPEPLPAQYHVGDVVPLNVLVGLSAAATLKLPDGSQVTLSQNQTNFNQTTIPGVYNVNTDRGTKKFVVNLDPVESRTAPLPVDELERFGVPMAKTVEATSKEAQKRARLQSAELENRQKLWRWFVAGTLLVLILETWLAGQTARQTAPPAAAAGV